MSNDKEPQGDERRQRKERRKERILPYLGKERRAVEVVREADVFEINIPPLTAPTDRRNLAKRAPKSK